ncbi:MAG: 50S ribosomal protein L32 [Candidatus Babeliaceae bacterium]|nr:50S ribosomal protein L32 [Candidatus Babeliaceae bacterium]
MPVPKRKLSRSRRDMRSANKGLDPQPLMFCHEGSCQASPTPRLPHQVCPNCGFYRGKKVLRTKKDRALSRDEVRSKKAQQPQEGAQGE